MKTIETIEVKGKIAEKLIRAASDKEGKIKAIGQSPVQDTSDMVEFDC